MLDDKCDFYVMDHDGKIEWIGSCGTKGSPNDLPPKLFLHSEFITFEESILDYLKENKGIIRYEGHKRPWWWDNGFQPDYSYVFNICSGKVLMSYKGSRLVDVIDILRGFDMISADAGIGAVRLPHMFKKVRKGNKVYGSNSAEVV